MADVGNVYMAYIGSWSTFCLVQQGLGNRPVSESETERKRARNASSESERDFFSLRLKRKISSVLK